MWLVHRLCSAARLVGNVVGSERLTYIMKAYKTEREFCTLSVYFTYKESLTSPVVFVRYDGASRKLQHTTMTLFHIVTSGEALFINRRLSLYDLVINRPNLSVKGKEADRFIYRDPPEPHLLQEQRTLGEFVICTSVLALLLQTIGVVKKDQLVFLNSDVLYRYHTYQYQLICVSISVLNPEPDKVLGKATDERLSLFNHDTVPQYLRTKLEPKLESQCESLKNRAALLPSEQINKYVNVTNRAAESSLKEVAILKQELASDFTDRSLNKLNVNTNDFMTMVSAITTGRGLTLPSRM